ncbi:MAG: CinA family protein [Pseudolabrys sp.]|nr:CinA family protein [Pseudolabrys sp.]
MHYEVTEASAALIKFCTEYKLRLATAESCTGGLVAAALTEAPGSSAVFEGGFVTYSDDAKQQMLSVPANTLKLFGAVSRQTAEAMSEGALLGTKADFAVSITGIAGPDGGTPEKPVGLVHFSCVSRNGASMHAVKKFGDIGRAEVRRKSVVHALRMLTELTQVEAAKRPRWKPRPPPEPVKEFVIKEWPDKMRKI